MRHMTGKMKRIAALVLVLMMLSVSAMAEMEAVVFSSRMKVYFAPSTTSEQIASIKSGKTVEVEAVSNGWARINYNGTVGFAKVSDMLSLSPAKVKTVKVSPILYFTREDSTIRWGTLDRNTTVYLRSVNGDLALVSDVDMNILACIPLNCIK